MSSGEELTFSLSNHRVFRRDGLLFVGETHYDKFGSPHIWSVAPEGVVGKNVKELRSLLESMQMALGRPILDWEEAEKVSSKDEMVMDS